MLSVMSSQADGQSDHRNLLCWSFFLRLQKIYSSSRARSSRHSRATHTPIATFCAVLKPPSKIILISSCTCSTCAYTTSCLTTREPWIVPSYKNNYSRNGSGAHGKNTGYMCENIKSKPPIYAAVKTSSSPRWSYRFRLTPSFDILPALYLLQLKQQHIFKAETFQARKDKNLGYVHAVQTSKWCCNN